MKNMCLIVLLFLPLAGFAFEPYIFTLPVAQDSKLNRAWNTYYKHPKPNELPEIINAMIDNGAFDGHDDGQLTLAMTFLTQILKSNPEKIEVWMDNIHFTTRRQRQVVYEAILNSNTKQARSLLQRLVRSDNPEIAGAAKKIINQSPENILNKEITARTLDQLWSAYFATGQGIYLQKMIEYINQDNYLLIVGYEIVNRQYICEVLKRATPQSKEQQKTTNSICGEGGLKDIYMSIKKHYPKNYKETMRRAVIISSAIWSLNANRGQDQMVALKIKKIISDRPEWDYLEKFKEALG